MKVFLDVDPISNVIRGRGSTPINSNPIEVEIEETSEFLRENRTDLYVYIDGQIIKDDSIVLKKARSSKIDSLTKDCNKTIVGRFSHVVDGRTYFFSNDMEAQSNFEKADRAFEKGRFTEISWTCYDEGGNVCRLVFTEETFEGLYIAHLQHIQYNITKFRDILMPQVESATLEELDTIIW